MTTLQLTGRRAFSTKARKSWEKSDKRNSTTSIVACEGKKVGAERVRVHGRISSCTTAEKQAGTEHYNSGHFAWRDEVVNLPPPCLIAVSPIKVCV